MNENTAPSPASTNDSTAAAVKIVILALILIPVARYVFVNNEDEVETAVTPATFDNETEILPSNHTESEDVVPKVTKKYVVEQPSCSKSFLLVILADLCEEFVFRSEFCVPSDVHDEKKHRIPERARNRQPKEAKVPAIVNYAVGGLLMGSLGAALLELYRAKMQPSKKDGKNPLSRKCSLADLTVLKHHRKELVRRESILEEYSAPSRQSGRKVSRLPLRLE